MSMTLTMVKGMAALDARTRRNSSAEFNALQMRDAAYWKAVEEANFKANEIAAWERACASQSLTADEYLQLVHYREAHGVWQYPVATAG
jgi:hypothetical protein